MNIPNNSFQPVLIWADPPVFDRVTETSITPHTFLKERPDLHESFVMEVPVLEDRDWFRCEFVSPQTFDLTLQTILMWSQVKGKRFTGCNPTAAGSNLGFEAILTVGRVYVRDAVSLEVSTFDTPELWRDELLALNTVDTVQMGMNGFGFGLYEDRGMACSLSYTTPPNIGHSAGFDYMTTFPYGEDLIFGVGEPPVMYPGMSRTDCFRPKVLFLGNDV